MDFEMVAQYRQVVLAICDVCSNCPSREGKPTHLLHLLERRLAHAAFLEIGRRCIDHLFDDLEVDVALQYSVSLHSPFVDRTREQAKGGGTQMDIPPDYSPSLLRDDILIVTDALLLDRIAGEQQIRVLYWSLAARTLVKVSCKRYRLEAPERQEVDVSEVLKRLSTSFRV